jgi:hypothetical protein
LTAQRHRVATQRNDVALASGDEVPQVPLADGAGTPHDPTH